MSDTQDTTTVAAEDVAPIPPEVVEPTVAPANATGDGTPDPFLGEISEKFGAYLQATVPADRSVAHYAAWLAGAVT